MKKSIILGLAASASVFAANNQQCEPGQPVPCNMGGCSPCFCLGPADPIANAPVNPRTCDGDLILSVSALYWGADQDGLAYAIENAVAFSGSTNDQQNLIDAEYKTPKFKRDFGYKLEVAYASPCDGWDLRLDWTHFKGKGSSHDQSDFDDENSSADNDVLITLWSAFHSDGTMGDIYGPVASSIDTDWRATMDWVDLDLGRDYWVSKYLAFRPHVGLRGARLNQQFNIDYSGGTWSRESTDELNDEVKLKNDYKAIGPRIGIDLNWGFGCGWSIYSGFAAAILYGRFDVDQDEQVRLAVSPFSKRKVLETETHFRASRAALDVVLGVEYAALICDCKYGIMARLGWEQHLFFNQNQLWRVNRIGVGQAQQTPFDNDGENAFFQRRGNLATQGLTLTFAFTF